MMNNPIDDEQDRENPWNRLEERRSEREEKSHHLYMTGKEKSITHIYDRKGKVYHTHMTTRETKKTYVHAYINY